MSERRGSIRRQMLLMTSMVLVVVGGAALWSAHLYADRAARLSYDRLLRGAALQISENIHMLDGRVVADLPASAFDMLAMAPRDRAFYAIIDSGKRVVTGYADLPSVPFETLIEARDREGQFQPRLYDVDYRGETVRFLGVAKRLIEADNAETVYIVVGQTLKARKALADEVGWFVLQFVALFFVLTLALLMLGIWRVLRPLNRLQHAIAERSPTDLQPLGNDVPREIAPLLDTLNYFMAQLQISLDRLKRFTAEAAHQIRTPLAGLHSQAQNALDEPDPEIRQRQLKHVLECSESLTRTVNQLLQHANLTHRFQSQPRIEVSLRQIATEVCRSLVIWGLDRGVELVYEGDEDVRVTGDAFALEQMIRNLVENAVKYSPAGSLVTLRLTEVGAGAELEVSDQGPGISDEEKPRVFERFYRSCDIDQPGSGLGLSIAREVAQYHGAELELHDNQPQGLVVRVRFNGEAIH